MKRIFCTLVMLVMFVCQTAFAANFENLVILHTNDSHGFDKYGDGSNGMAMIAQVKKDYEAEGYEVLLLDAGDAIQDNNLVNFSKGEAAVAFMNSAGYDAATFGNHEFDYGQDILAQRIKQAKFAYISANVIVDATGKTLTPAPYAVFDLESAKVGVIGLTTPETINSTSPKNTHGLTFLKSEQLYSVTQKAVDELKAQGCELIVIIGHLGSEDACKGDRAEDIIANVKGIDILIDGHDHLVKNNVVGETLWVEAGNYTKNIGRLVYEDDKWQSKPIAFGTYGEEYQDAVTKKIIDKYDAEVQRVLGQVLGENKVELTGDRAPGLRTMETNSGDFVADAILWQARKASVLDNPVDAAIVNGGGIRKAIHKGPIKRADFIAARPYNEQMYVIKISGAKLLEIIEAATSSTPEAMGAFPQVANITYTINTKVKYTKGEQYPKSMFFAPKNPGSRVTIQTVNGKPWEKDKIYTIALGEFLSLGGDAYGGLTLPGAVISKQSIGYIDCECLENYLVEELSGVIGPEYEKAQGRIVIK